MTSTKSRNPRTRTKSGALLGFAERLSELRRGSGLTIEAFATAFSAKQNTVRDWLNGKVLPRADALIGIARHFGVSIDWLLGIDGAPKHPTQWRKASDFEGDLALAIADRVRRRGGLASALIDVLVVDGHAALEVLADHTEQAAFSHAENLADWVSKQEASLAIKRHFDAMETMVTGRVLRKGPDLPHRLEHGQIAVGREHPQELGDDLPKRGTETLDEAILQAAAFEIPLEERDALASPELRRLLKTAHLPAKNGTSCRSLCRLEPQQPDHIASMARRVASVFREHVNNTIAAHRV